MAVNKKKLSERVNTIKPLVQKIFEDISINLSDEQLVNFVSAFELLKEKFVNEAVTPIQVKMEEYQKKNYELQGKLEEATLKSKEFDKVLNEKIEEVNKIKIPKFSNIEKEIENKFTEKMDLIEKKISKFDEIAKKIDEKIIPLKLDEELVKIQDVIKLFENYKESFVKMLAESESTEIKKLSEKLIESEKKLSESSKNVVVLQEQMKKDKEFTQITLTLENSNLNKEDKELLYKLAEKLSFDESKNEIQKYILIKEEKERNEPKSPQRQLKETSSGIKSTNDIGLLGTRKTFTESSSHKNDMDLWEDLAGINIPKK